MSVNGVDIIYFSVIVSVVTMQNYGNKKYTSLQYKDNEAMS